MHHRVLLAGLAGLAYGSPVAQLIPLDQIATFAPLPSVSVPMGDGASSQSVSYDATKVISSTFASVTAHPASGSVARRDACAQQPLGSGPSPSTDTDKDFLEYSALSDIAIKASTPSGYTRTFKNFTASNNAMAYMGYMSLDSYDTQQCADECTKKDGCISFNIYFERDPSVDPAPACANPTSTTVIKCVWWGSPIDAATAVNDGQWRQNFHVVIAGSNGYVSTLVDDVPGYSKQYYGKAAINAPLDCNQHDSYMGYKLFNDGKPFNVARCAAACEAESQWNIQHLGGRMLCRFFNTYVLNKNGVPQGQYCSMYNETWSGAYATNDGQYRGDDHYTISYSIGYSNVTDPGVPSCTINSAAQST